MKVPALFPALLVFLAVITGGPAWAQEAGKAAPGSRQAMTLTEYRIGPEDILEIVVWNNAPMSRTVPVRPDGKITLPLLNDIEAAGRTSAQLREFMIEKLKAYMPAPEVSVIVSDVRSLKVSLIGEVVRPGRFELKSWATVLDVLALAGGFNQFASRSRIVVLRREGDALKRIPFNYNRVVSAEGEQENIYLQPGDIVLVP